MSRLLLLAASFAALSAGSVFAQDQDAPEEKSCAILYQGETSRFRACDNGSVDWTLPRDAFRIDRPLSPGENSIIKAPERAIRENARGLERAWNRLF